MLKKGWVKVVFWEIFLVHYLDFYFSISLLPSFFAFLASFCFSFAGNLEGFILVGKCFRKAFRILGLDERKGRWVEEQDFHGNFLVNGTLFFYLFHVVRDWIVLILVWFERSLHSTQVSGQSCPWPLKLKTSQAVEGTRICTGGHGRLRDEWVKCRLWSRMSSLSTYSPELVFSLFSTKNEPDWAN